MARYVRYAAAVVFALLAVAFVALWVRSYYRLEWAQVSFGKIGYFDSNSAFGVLTFLYFENAPVGAPHSWTMGSELHEFESPIDTSILYFKAGYQPPFTYLSLPHWFLAASSFALAALFAFKKSWRFSVRSILMATTLIAAALGLAVYAMS